MKAKTTRRALLMSILSLVLCVSMLVGATFAWFTDSVTSANNIIKSGNLDVELYYQVEGQTDWTKVDNTTNVFKDALWEPGHTEVVKLKVVNEGTLALKYQLGVNIVSELGSTNVEGNAFELSDFIKYGIVEGAQTYTREQAIAAVDATATNLKGAYNSKTVKLLPKTDVNTDNEDIVTMVVYMPTTVGNAANHADGANVPTINLGVNLFATQVEAESDSFGDNYDADAWHPKMQVYTAADLQDALNNAEPGTEIVVENDLELEGPIVIPAPAATTYSLRSAPAAVVLNLNGKKITTAYNESTKKHQYAIDNYGSVVINGGTIEARGIYNRDGATMTVNGTKIVNLDNNGGSCIWGYNGAIYLNNAELIGYTGCVYSEGYLEINGGNYTCYSAILDDGTQLAPTYNIRSIGDVVINDGNFTSRHGLVAVKGNAVINGGTYTMTSIGVITSHVFYVYGTNAQVNINGGEFNCDLRTAQNNGSSMICVDATGVDVNVSGGTYNIAPKGEHLAEGYKAVETSNGFVVIPADCNYVADGVLVSEDGKNYYISNRAGYAWMDAQADNFFGNKTINLTADIDFGGETITGIKFWNSKPTFDGNGHTLSNYVIGHSGSKSPSGLFSGTFNVKNLIIDGAKVTGDYAAAISGNMYGNIDNCTVKNSTINCTYWQGGALAAQYNNGNVTNCTVENCTISGGSAVGALIGILNETAGVRKVENCTVKGCTVAMTNGFGGDWDNYFGAAVGLINVENSEIYFNNCNISDTTVKGVASTTLYGADEGNTIFIDGVAVSP